MAFDTKRFVRQTLAYNAGQITTALNPSVTPILSNGPAMFSYASATDAIATIAAANYFAPVVLDLSVNDFLFVVGSDAANFYTVTAVDRDAGTITIGSMSTAGVVGTANIQDGAITNAKVNASAAIDFSKLAALPSAQILVGSAGNVATAVALTGPIAISNTGLTSFAAGSIVNADISASAAIAFSKLATLTSGNILVGSAGNAATSVAMSGDATIIASGALTIANNAITTAKILNANVTLAKLATGITPSHVIKFAAQHTTVGGAAAEAITVTGAVAATDRAFVQVVNDGTANVTVLQAVVTTDTLTVTFSANPGNDTIINYQLIRAAA